MQRVAQGPVEPSFFGVVVLRVDPQLERVPYDDFVPAVTGNIENGVAHVGVTVGGKRDDAPAAPVKETAFLGTGREHEIFL